MSLVVIALAGELILQRVSRGIYDDQHRAALADASSGLAFVRAQLAQSDADSVPTYNLLLAGVTQSLESQGGPTGILHVLLLPASSGAQGVLGGDTAETDVSPALRARVSLGEQASEYVRLEREGLVPGLVVGAPVSTRVGASYQLYYVFPLASEQATVSLVRRTVLVAGILLVLLVAGVALLVTRQVVTPVRMAARIAERLAAGRLTERLAESGEDEIALLATSFNRMAVSLQQQIAALEELSRVQRRFVADVSHELRTPVTTVRMAADVLHDYRETFPPPAARSAELLQAELDRFERLLADLLEISRFDAQAAALEAEPTDVAAVVWRVVRDAAPLAARRGSVLEVVGGDESVIADADPRRVERVLRNLVVNAVEHGEGRPVQVLLGADDAAVAVVVRDHGVGLRPGDETQVFRRFWRADPARARHTGGTGLGLSIALEDARLHGGWLEAAGQPGLGSVFRVTLPREAGRALTGSPLPLALTAGGGSGAGGAAAAASRGTADPQRVRVRP